MKRILLTFCVASIFLLSACSIANTDIPNAKSSQSKEAISKKMIIPKERTIDHYEYKKSHPTPYAIINAFHLKMLNTFGNQTPDLVQGRYTNIWKYDFGEYFLEVSVSFNEKNPEELHLSMKEISTSDKNFKNMSSKILKILLGDFSDDEYTKLITYAKEQYRYLGNEPVELTGNLSSLSGIMYDEQKCTATTTLYILKATY